MRGRTAMDDKTGGGHKAGIVGGEKNDALGDVVGHAEPANRVPRPSSQAREFGASQRQT